MCIKIQGGEEGIANINYGEIEREVYELFICGALQGYSMKEVYDYYTRWEVD